MESNKNPWDAVLGLITEIKKCEDASSHIGALSLCYICIDTMAQLAMPDGKASQTREDFIAWVDTHLKEHEDQPYKYRGIDVYAARCALLHSYGSEATLHKRDSTIKKFCYHDGGKHMIDPAVNSQLVIIGLASLINDVIIAVGEFMKACQTDDALRARVERRLSAVLTNFPVPSS